MEIGGFLSETNLMYQSGHCGVEYFYREKFNLWHIGNSDRSAYLYNLTGTEKLQLEATTTKTTGGSHLYLI